ncbi:MAG: ribokinase [Chloroflexi bacterium]|nr:MAG: ribokinase [Chloroflexota bacterium]
MSARVVVVGSLNMDLVTRAKTIPIPGETVIGGDLETIPGGKGANQAVAAARSGAVVSMVGHVGTDVFADRLKENLAADGIDQAFVTAVPGASGVALIVVDAAGQNSIVVAPGANAALTPTDVDEAAKAIQSANVLLLQLEIPLDAVQRAAQLAHDAGVTVILNPAPAQPLPADLLALVDILIPNESETATLTGMPTSNETELEAAAAYLRTLGVGMVILTLGKQGALFTRQNETVLIPAFQVTKVVDTTAAGDAFLGGFATAVAEAKPLHEAITIGNATGALAVTRAGAQPSLPTRKEVEALLKK